MCPSQATSRDERQDKTKLGIYGDLWWKFHGTRHNRWCTVSPDAYGMRDVIDEHRGGENTLEIDRKWASRAWTQHFWGYSTNDVTWFDNENSYLKLGGTVVLSAKRNQEQDRQNAIIWRVYCVEFIRIMLKPCGALHMFKFSKFNVFLSTIDDASSFPSCLIVYPVSAQRCQDFWIRPSTSCCLSPMFGIERFANAKPNFGQSRHLVYVVSPVFGAPPSHTKQCQRTKQTALKR